MTCRPIALCANVFAHSHVFPKHILMIFPKLIPPTLNKILSYFIEENTLLEIYIIKVTSILCSMIFKFIEDTCPSSSLSAKFRKGFRNALRCRSRCCGLDRDVIWIGNSSQYTYHYSSAAQRARGTRHTAGNASMATARI